MAGQSNERLLKSLYEAVIKDSNELIDEEEFNASVTASISAQIKEYKRHIVDQIGKEPLVTDEPSRVLSYLVKQAENNPNSIGDIGTNSFKVSDNAITKAMNTVILENEYIPGKVECDNRELLSQNMVDMATVVMTPQLLSNMVDNLESLSQSERNNLFLNYGLLANKDKAKLVGKVISESEKNGTITEQGKRRLERYQEALSSNDEIIIPQTEEECSRFINLELQLNSLPESIIASVKNMIENGESSIEIYKYMTSTMDRQMGQELDSKDNPDKTFADHGTMFQTVKRIYTIETLINQKNIPLNKRKSLNEELGKKKQDLKNLKKLKEFLKRNPGIQITARQEEMIFEGVDDAEVIKSASIMQKQKFDLIKTGTYQELHLPQNIINYIEKNLTCDIQTPLTRMYIIDFLKTQNLGISESNLSEYSKIIRNSELLKRISELDKIDEEHKQDAERNVIIQNNSELVEKEISEMPKAFLDIGMPEPEVKDAFETFAGLLSSDDFAKTQKASFNKQVSFVKEYFQTMKDDGDITSNTYQILNTLIDTSFHGQLEEILRNPDRLQEFVKSFEEAAKSMEQPLSQEPITDEELKGVIRGLSENIFEQSLEQENNFDDFNDKFGTTKKIDDKFASKDSGSKIDKQSAKKSKIEPDEQKSVDVQDKVDKVVMPKSDDKVAPEDKKQPEEITSQTPGTEMAEQDNSFIGKMKRVVANMRYQKEQDNKKGFFSRLTSSINDVFGNKKETDENPYEVKDEVDASGIKKSEGETSTKTPMQGYDINQHFEVNSAEALKKTQDSSKAKNGQTAGLQAEQQASDDITQDGPEQ